MLHASISLMARMQITPKASPSCAPRPRTFTNPLPSSPICRGPRFELARSLGVHEGDALLSQLAAAVGALLEPVGSPPEERQYHAHLTLARLKAPADLRPVVAELGSAAVGRPWTADEVVLFQSKTRSTGAEYIARARFPLS